MRKMLFTVFLSLVVLTAVGPSSARILATSSGPAAQQAHPYSKEVTGAIAAIGNDGQIVRADGE